MVQLDTHVGSCVSGATNHAFCVNLRLKEVLFMIVASDILNTRRSGSNWQVFYKTKKHQRAV